MSRLAVIRPWLRAGIAALALGWLGLRLWPSVVERYGALAAGIQSAAASISTTSFEQRRRAAYGDCGGIGYGYLRQILRAFPEDDAYPALRYPVFLPGVEQVVPGYRFRIEERVLVGIALTEGEVPELADPATRFVVIHRRASCFTAVERSLLDEARQDPRGKWAAFIESIRNVHPT